MSTTVVDLYSATRLNNSVNGNPRYTLHTTGGNYTTSSDSACAYDVQNILHGLRGEAVRVTLHTTRAGRVWNIVKEPVSHLEEAKARRACMDAHPAGKGLHRGSQGV